jgi:alcohol dehydrogenase class IV
VDDPPVDGPTIDGETVRKRPGRRDRSTQHLSPLLDGIELVMYEPESVWDFSMVDRLTFGPGSVEELGADLAERGVEHLLVVTDADLRGTGVVDAALDSVPDDVVVDVFDGVRPDPEIGIYRAATETVAEVDPDAVVGVGGGSSMDVAKVSGALVDSEADVLDHVAPPIGSGEPVPDPDRSVIAVPTTAGTGSESSPAAVVSLPDRELKVGISSRHLYPDLAVVDPLLAVSLPPAITASSGMDALTHAIESYVTRRYDAKEAAGAASDRPNYGGRTAMTDLHAEKAIDLIGGSLRRAVDNGRDVEARRDMALGSLLAGVSFTNAGLGATHAMAYPVAGENHTPHGVTVAVLLPSVMRYNAPTAPERYGRIAELLGEPVDGLAPHERGERAAAAVDQLAADIDVPDGLAELGVEVGDVPRLAEKTEEIQRLLVGNPRRVEREDIEGMLRDAL